MDKNKNNPPADSNVEENQSDFDQEDNLYDQSGRKGGQAGFEDSLEEDDTTEVNNQTEENI